MASQKMGGGMHTHLKTVAAALLGTLISTSAFAAITVFDATEYTVTYDDATPFGGISFWGGGGGLFFGWTSPAPSVYGAYTTGDGASHLLNFPTLSFTVAAKSGYQPKNRNSSHRDHRGHRDEAGFACFSGAPDW
jgi:hypothetical protein